MTRSCSAFAYLTLFSLFGLSQGFLTAPANAQVTPVEGWSKVNDGTAGCTSGVCKISGGVSSGKNLFHKLEKLNTKNGTIEKVSIDNIDQTSIILANIGSDLSEISVPFEALGSKADIAIFPFIRQFAFVDKAWFDSADYPALQRWLNHFLQSDLFNQVMQKHTVWQQFETQDQ